MTKWAKTKYSPVKIGFIVILTVGVSVALYYGFDDVNKLSYTLNFATDVEVSKLKTEVQNQESELTELKKELEIAKHKTPVEHQKSGGCGITHQCGAALQALENKVNNLIESLAKKKAELSIKDGELYCNVISKVVTFNLDGTHTESSSSIIESIRPLSLSDKSLSTDNASLKIGDIGVKKVRLIPTIQCESLPAPIKIHSSDLKLVIKSDRTISPISTQDARVKSFELNSSSDYELVIFEIDSNSLLKQVDFGNYQSEFYLSVYGSIILDFMGLDVVDGKIVIDKDELVTTLKTEISKSDEIREVAKVIVIEPEPVITKQEFGLPETSFVQDYDWSLVQDYDWSLFLENTVQNDDLENTVQNDDWSFLENTVQNVVINQEPSKVNDQRFTVQLVLLGFLFILIALLVKKYTRKMLIEK